VYRKCQACGYHKISPNEATCNLCGAVLSEQGFGGQDPSIRFGEGKDLRRAKVEEKRANKPTDDQIVYAGDFAIVYAFVPVQGGTIVLQPGEVFTFGRGDTVDYQVDSKVVSRRHARIHWVGTDPPVPEVVDLDSKNGVRVNCVPVRRKVLDDGDEVTIGPFVATLKVLSANDDLSHQVQPDRLSATMVSSERLFGEIRLVPMPWLLGHLERIKESGTLSVQNGEQHGSVTMISGVAIAATFDEATGADAIRQVARLRDGRFSFSPRADQAPQAINRSLSEILSIDAAAGPARTGRTRRPRPGPPPRRRPPPRRPPPRRP